MLGPLQQQEQRRPSVKTRQQSRTQTRPGRRARERKQSLSLRRLQQSAAVLRGGRPSGNDWNFFLKQSHLTF